MAVLDAGCSWRESHSWKSLWRIWIDTEFQAMEKIDFFSRVGLFCYILAPTLLPTSGNRCWTYSIWIKVSSHVTSFCFVVVTTEVCPCKMSLFLKCKIQWEHFPFHRSRSGLLPHRLAAWMIITKIKSGSILSLNVFCDASCPRKPLSSPPPSFYWGQSLCVNKTKNVRISV